MSSSRMHPQLHQAEAQHVEELHAILAACGLDMQARFGLSHWVPPYPLHLMQRDAEAGYVYATREGEHAIATFTVTPQPPAYYDQRIWHEPDARALYLHRLAVLPANQRQGLGRWCLEQVEAMARAQGCTAVRFDAYDQHTRLCAFYLHLGYEQRGAFKMITKTYGETGGICFEKRL
jgi:GNAT superfamily N-acetyltransferase